MHVIARLSQIVPACIPAEPCPSRDAMMLSGKDDGRSSSLPCAKGHAFPFSCAGNHGENWLVGRLGWALPTSPLAVKARKDHARKICRDPFCSCPAAFPAGVLQGGPFGSPQATRPFSSVPCLALARTLRVVPATPFGHGHQHKTTQSFLTQRCPLRRYGSGVSRGPRFAPRCSE